MGWVDRALLAVPPRAVDRIVLSAATLERDGEDWRFPDRPASAPAVRAWLEAVAAVRAREIVPVPATRPRARVGIGPQERLLHRVDGRLVVQRAGEPVGLRLRDDLEAFLDADPLVFRDLGLLSFDAWSLASIAYELDAPARAVRGESADDWRLEPPALGAADARAVAALREAAHDLRAVQIVAERARPEHQLPRRRLVLLVDPAPTDPTGSPPHRLVLELGARFPDRSCVARRGGEATVFLLSPADCEALDVKLVP